MAVIHGLKPKANMPKRWNTLRVSAWGFLVGLIYGVVDQFFLSDYEDDFLSENTVVNRSHRMGCGLRSGPVRSCVRSTQRDCASKVAGSPQLGVASGPVTDHAGKATGKSLTLSNSGQTRSTPAA
jgi:hypothetical protein